MEKHNVLIFFFLTDGQAFIPFAVWASVGELDSILQ
jgi:hypothetical protein